MCRFLRVRDSRVPIADSFDIVVANHHIVFCESCTPGKMLRKSIGEFVWKHMQWYLLMLYSYPVVVCIHASPALAGVARLAEMQNSCRSSKHVSASDRCQAAHPAKVFRGGVVPHPTKLVASRHHKLNSGLYSIHLELQETHRRNAGECGDSLDINENVCRSQSP